MHAAKLNKAGGVNRPKVTNPGWEHDQALAGAAAVQLAAGLREAISSRALARNWLARSGFKARKGSAGSWLSATALAAAIQAVLNRILRQLWQDSWELGRRSASQILGTEEITADEAELNRLLAQADGRIPGMVQTRVAQIENILDGAGTETTAEALESELEDALGDESRALLVTQTETTWSMAEGMLGVYYQMGVQTMGWLTAEDDRVCLICSENEDDGFIAAGDSFSSGDTQPPSHSRCRCCLVPGDISGVQLPFRD
jgi:SPP1 gp7 family putative phage head morphogenesis protein